MPLGPSLSPRIRGRWPPPRRRRRRRTTLAARHRRRRAGALLCLVAVVAVLIATMQSGGATPPRPLAGGETAYFSRIQALAGTGRSSLSAIEKAEQNDAIDRTLAYTPYVRIAGSQHRELALTFDDGPGPYTPEIIAILERYRVPATFFEVGVLERWFHASTTQIIAIGDVIGDHTELHPPMSRLSAALQRGEILDQAQAIGQYGAPFPRLFRPPYGLWNSVTLALLRQYRMLMILWTVDTNDYLRPGTKAIIDAAVHGARPGAIILLHDGGGDRSETAAALPTIIKRLRAAGYRLVTVPTLLADNPAPANQQFSAIAGSGG